MCCVTSSDPKNSLAKKKEKKNEQQLKIMSTFSLPRLINGGGLSKNKVVNSKFASLNNRQRPVSDSYSDQFMRRKALNRNGSIVKNQFRGVRKEYLDTQTKLIIHSMTVSL